MNMRRRESGMSVIGMLIIGIMVGFFVMCAIRMVPKYMEYLTIKQVVTKIATEHGAVDMSVSDIRRKLAAIFNTNQIYAMKPRDVEVYRKKGKTYIDASYEMRVPIMGRIDAIMSFDDLVFIAGQPIP